MIERMRMNRCIKDMMTAVVSRGESRNNGELRD